MPGEQYAFVVRIRLEKDPAEPGDSPIVRGSLQQLGLGPTRYFSTLEGITALLREMMVSSPASDGREGDG